MKILVTYFSASYGITREVAKRLAKGLGADVQEIEPKEIYTEADLNWMDKNSRSTLEMQDLSSRPEIKTKIDVSSYDIIFVGFPVWWYREPSIIDTFLESADFSGKVLIPFATSGSSGIGKSSDNFRRLAPKAKVLEGRVIKRSESDVQIISWAKSLLK